jgi:hypothetical protein
MPVAGQIWRFNACEIFEDSHATTKSPLSTINSIIGQIVASVLASIRNRIKNISQTP